ncbi:MAG: FAD-binding oxidoreductase [Candidatus Nezhaarchaeota archaeon]|nr:FAD-binding oxidoreductase [Candidatus Nezhaarchaeota archaeon]
MISEDSTIIKMLDARLESSEVFSDEETLSRYSQDASLYYSCKPLCVVRPSLIDDVKSVLEMCNRYKVPVTPFSTGLNNQGLSVPSEPGVVLDLSGLRNILVLDEDSWMATVQPGVTFDDLNEEASKRGLRPLTTYEWPSKASVISAYLDYQALFSWPRYSIDTMTTMTVVLPSGEILKTGVASIPVAKQPYTSAFGVPFAGLMDYLWFGSQGTLGIIVEGTVKLKPVRECNEVFFIEFNDFDDVHKMLREIMWQRSSKELMVLNAFEAALLFSERIEDVSDVLKLMPKYLVILTLRGPSREVEFEREDFEDLSRKMGFKLDSELKGVSNAPQKVLHEINRPQGWLRKARHRGRRVTIPFMALTRNIKALENAIFNVAERYKYSKAEIGVAAIPVGVGRSYCQVSFSFESKADLNKLRTMVRGAVKELMISGAFFDKPYPLWADIVYERCPAYFRVIRKFKRIVDPNNICNPGKLCFQG